MNFLKERVKNTLLLDPDTKKKLEQVEWDKNIKKIVKNIYDKYWEKENKILNDLKWKMIYVYIDGIKHIEKQNKNKELEELKKMTEKLKNI